MTIVIDTEDGMEHMKMCQIIAMLSIEVKTGMTHSRGSVLKYAQQRYGIKSRTKQGALDQMRDLYATTYGRQYGSK